MELLTAISRLQHLDTLWIAADFDPADEIDWSLLASLPALTCLTLHTFAWVSADVRSPTGALASIGRCSQLHTLTLRVHGLQDGVFGWFLASPALASTLEFLTLRCPRNVYRLVTRRPLLRLSAAPSPRCVAFPLSRSWNSNSTSWSKR